MRYFYASLVTYIFFTFIKYLDIFKILKKEKYDTKKYGKNITKNFKQYFVTPELIVFIVIVVALNFDIKTTEIFMIIIYMILFLYKLRNSKMKIIKDKKIIVRSIIVLLLYGALNIWFYLDYKAYHGSEIIFETTPLYYIILIISTYLSHFVVWLVNVVAKPIDKLLK